MAVQKLERVFKLGATELPDPNPAWPPEKVLAHYRPNYPQLAVCHVGGQTVEGGRMVYEIVQPKPGLKG